MPIRIVIADDHAVVRQGTGVNHCISSAGSVQARQTSLGGTATSRFSSRSSCRSNSATVVNPLLIAVIDARTAASMTRIRTSSPSNSI